MASFRPALTEAPQRTNKPHWDRPVNSGPRPCLIDVGFPQSGPRDRTSTSDLKRHAWHTAGPPGFALWAGDRGPAGQGRPRPEHPERIERHTRPRARAAARAARPRPPARADPDAERRADRRRACQAEFRMNKPSPEKLAGLRPFDTPAAGRRCRDQVRRADPPHTPDATRRTAAWRPAQYGCCIRRCWVYSRTWSCGGSHRLVLWRW